MNTSTIEKYTSLIKHKAAELGFSYCAISKARFLEEEANHLDTWLKNGFHGKMSYMENHFEKRLDPTKLVDDAKSVVSLMFNYFPDQEIKKEGNYTISKYAYGEDYHFVIKRRLKELMTYIESEIGQVNMRSFVDSAPVLERVWAVQSGLGWIGKNAMLIHPRAGSFFFLAELILDLELKEDQPINADFCGHCQRCIQACPTNAIRAPRIIDSNRCISYLTIELKDEIPELFKGKMKNNIFGCDICQDVCPWNRFSVNHSVEAFMPNDEMKTFRKKDWEDITEETYQKVFKNSAIKRTKYKGFRKNILFNKNRKNKK